MTLVFRLNGRSRRSPSEYRATDWLTFASKQRLHNTHEYVHASVRVRMGLRGYGYNDKGFYDSQGLQGWTMEGTEDTSSSASSSSVATEGGGNTGATTIIPGLSSMKDVKWVKRSREKGEDLVFVMPEDELGDVEHEIMKSWPNVERAFTLIRPGTHPVLLNKASTDPAMLSPKELMNIRNNSSRRRFPSFSKSGAAEIERARKTPTL
jgi:hypothetical protein